MGSKGRREGHSLFIKLDVKKQTILHVEYGDLDGCLPDRNLKTFYI